MLNILWATFYVSLVESVPVPLSLQKHPKGWGRRSTADAYTDFTDTARGIRALPFPCSGLWIGLQPPTEVEYSATKHLVEISMKEIYKMEHK